MVKSAVQGGPRIAKLLGEKPRPGSPQAPSKQPHPGPQLQPGRQRPNEAGDLTRARIVNAALQTLIAAGYSNTSVRAIAATGGFTPGLVFYHFGSVDALLLAVLDRVSGERLVRYKDRLENVSDVRSLAAAMEELYAEDLQLGQLTAVQEIVGAMAFDPVLGAEIVQRMQAWITFGEQLAVRILAGSPLAGLIDPAVIGSAVIALYLGQEIVARMRAGDSSASTALMTSLIQAAPWIDQLLGKATTGRQRQATKVAIE
jgi:AcrR family transcriptional regulator